MRHLVCTLLLFIHIVTPTSCINTSSHATYVGIRNYTSPCLIKVNFKETGESYYDGDTLNVMYLNKYIFDTILLRTNISKNSYSFIAPSNREIGLRPMSYGRPITQIQICKSKDSILVIAMENKEVFDKLKKKGIVDFEETKFSTSIYINIR